MSQPDSPLDPELNEVAARLQLWTPRAVGLNRDRLLFSAGRAAAASDSQASHALQRIATLGLLVASLALGGLWLRERGQGESLRLALIEARQSSQRTVETPESPASRVVLVSDRPDPASYLVLSRRWGGEVDDLDASPTGPPTRSPSRPGPEDSTTRLEGETLTPLRASRPGGFPGL